MSAILDLIRANLRSGKSITSGISDNEWTRELDRYANFSDKRDVDGFLTGSELTVTDFSTPRPSLHLMASNHEEEFGAWGTFWDQFGGGFSCLDSVLAGKMSSHLDTNYVPTAPEPQDVRTFYVHENGASWTMFPTSSGDVAEYGSIRCTHGLDYHRMEAIRNGFAAELLVSVPPNQPLERYRVTLANRSNLARNFSWFVRIRVNLDSFPFYYFVPRVVCEGLLENDAMIFLNHDKGNRHPRQAFFAASPQFEGYDMMGEEFDGIGGRNALPDAVRRGYCGNSLGRQPYAGMIAAAQFCAKLAPGESRSWTIIYGACPYEVEKRRDYMSAIRRDFLNSSGRIEEEIAAVWQDKIDRTKIKTPSTELDRYFNIWSRYQARNQARFVRALDKIGYRDILQDLLGICDIAPEYVRTMLLRTLSYQLPDGRAIRQYEKFSGSGHDMRMYMDSSSWIPDLLCHYLAETGDFALLDESVPYYDEHTGQPALNCHGTVYEHSLRAVEVLAGTTGFHDLCKIGYGDWNDALSGIGGENGVSVWLSCACVYAAQKMAGLASYLGRTTDARRMADIATTMTTRINNHAWDGNWYIYAINGQGEPIGSHHNSEGRLHLNVNTWALFTGIAAAGGHEEQVLTALEQLDTPFGHRLLYPAYRHAERVNVGRIVDMKPGMFENGSIYTHGESFFLYALLHCGRADECRRRLLSTLPSALLQELATGPRHQQSNFTVGPDHENYGMQLFSNFTGSISWHRRVIETMLGIFPEFDMLVIQPRMLADWQEYECVKMWRGKRVRVICRRNEAERSSRISFNCREYSAAIPWDDFSADEENIVIAEF